MRVNSLRTVMVSAIKAAFVIFLLKMIIRLMNSINDILNIQLFFVHLFVMLCAKHQALCLKMELERKKEGAPSRNCTKTEHSKKMTTIAGHQYAFKAAHRRKIESKVCMFWNYEALSSPKLNNCGCDVEVLAREKKAKKLFRTSKEG